MRLSKSAVVTVKATTYEVAYNLETGVLHYRKNGNGTWVPCNKLPSCHCQALEAAGFPRVSNQVLAAREAVIEAMIAERKAAGLVEHDVNSLPQLAIAGSGGSMKCR